jgi:hypothetical protein
MEPKAQMTLAASDADQMKIVIPRKELERELPAFRKAALRLFSQRAGGIGNSKWLELLAEGDIDLCRARKILSLRPPVQESEVAGLGKLILRTRSMVQMKLQSPTKRAVFYFPVAHETAHDFDIIRPGLDRFLAAARTERKEPILILDFGGPPIHPSWLPDLLHAPSAGALSPVIRMELEADFNESLRVVLNGFAAVKRGQVPSWVGEGSSGAYSRALIEWAASLRVELLPEDVHFDNWLLFNWSNEQHHSADRLTIATGLASEAERVRYRAMMDCSIAAKIKIYTAREAAVATLALGQTQRIRAVALIYGAKHDPVVALMEKDGVRVLSEAATRGLRNMAVDEIRELRARSRMPSDDERMAIYLRQQISTVLDQAIAYEGINDRAEQAAIVDVLTSGWTLSDWYGFIGRATELSDPVGFVLALLDAINVRGTSDQRTHVRYIVRATGHALQTYKQTEGTDPTLT